MASKKRRRSNFTIVIAVGAFRRILRELRVVARKTELATGLSAAQLLVLSAVSATPGCSVNDIAQATMTDRSSVAAIVERLIDGGYVTRVPSADDRRRASITITSKGRRATVKAPPSPTALLLKGLGRLSSVELRGLTRGLVGLTEQMGIADEPAGMLFDDAVSRVRPRRRR